jgi:hypothetical protein
LLHYNYDAQTLLRVGRIHASLLDSKSEDPFIKSTALSLQRKFNSCLIVTDEFHPKDVFDRVFQSLQTSCSIAIFH